MTEVRSDSEALVLAELSMYLQGSDEPKVFCDDHRVDAKGYRVVSCTLELGHSSDHVDTHAGRTWKLNKDTTERGTL